jgi:hypothetical protein
MSYKLPYDFVLKELYPIRPEIRKMLGCYALIHEDKILMLLRDQNSELEFNGIFIATPEEHLEALKNEIHASKMQFDLDGSDTWIFISEDLNDFEEKVKKACAMIKAGDERLGKKLI